jgi:hypothetical protein
MKWHVPRVCDAVDHIACDCAVGSHLCGEERGSSEEVGEQHGEVICEA